MEKIIPWERGINIVLLVVAGTCMLCVTLLSVQFSLPCVKSVHKALLRNKGAAGEIQTQTLNASCRCV